MYCPSFTVIYTKNVCHLTSCFVGHVVSGIPLFSSMLKVLFNVCCVCLACGRMGCGWHESTCVYVLFLIYSSCCTFGISFGIFGECVWERVSFVLGSCAFFACSFFVWQYECLSVCACYPAARLLFAKANCYTCWGAHPVRNEYSMCLVVSGVCVQQQQ